NAAVCSQIASDARAQSPLSVVEKALKIDCVTWQGDLIGIASGVEPSGERNSAAQDGNFVGIVLPDYRQTGSARVCRRECERLSIVSSAVHQHGDGSRTAVRVRQQTLDGGLGFEDAGERTVCIRGVWCEQSARPGVVAVGGDVEI